MTVRLLATAEATFDAVVSRAGLMFLPDVAGTLGRLHTFLKPGGRIAASVWGPLPKVQYLAGFPIVFQELQRPLRRRDAQASWRSRTPTNSLRSWRVQASATSKPARSSPPSRRRRRRISRSSMSNLAPRSIVGLIDSQPREVRERLWRKVTEVWKQFLDDNGRVRTRDEAIWVAATK